MINIYADPIVVVTLALIILVLALFLNKLDVGLDVIGGKRKLGFEPDAFNEGNLYKKAIRESFSIKV